MDYLSKNVAANLKRIRKSKCMSLDQTAEQTGVSKSMLAQIERGTANPSLGVLGKVTSGLRIEFQELIQPPREDCLLVTPQELLPTKELEGQYRVWTCLPYEDTREYLAVTEGELTVECHGQSYCIHKDQIFKFETDQEHIYKNTGSEKACCTCFFLDYHGK